MVGSHPRLFRWAIVFVPLTVALYAIGEAGACCGQRDTLVWKVSAIVFEPARWLWLIAGSHPYGTFLDFNHLFYVSLVLVASCITALILACARIPAAVRRFNNSFRGRAA